MQASTIHFMIGCKRPNYKSRFELIGDAVFPGADTGQDELLIRYYRAVTLGASGLDNTIFWGFSNERQVRQGSQGAKT